MTVSSGTVTLTASTTTTVKADLNAYVGCHVGLMWKTSHGSNGATGTFISATNAGSFTITHPRNPYTDRDISYVIV